MSASSVAGSENKSSPIDPSTSYSISHSLHMRATAFVTRRTSKRTASEKAIQIGNASLLLFSRRCGRHNVKFRQSAAFTEPSFHMAHVSPRGFPETICFDKVRVVIVCKDFFDIGQSADLFKVVSQSRVFPSVVILHADLLLVMRYIHNRGKKPITTLVKATAKCFMIELTGR